MPTVRQGFVGDADKHDRNLSVMPTVRQGINSLSHSESRLKPTEEFLLFYRLVFFDCCQTKKYVLEKLNIFRLFFKLKNAILY
jgi:hypothetical protein